MLSRLYLDNFCCFVNFEYRPDRKQLLVGRSGSGKTTLLEALLRLRQFVAMGNRVEDAFPPVLRTLWESRPRQTFEVGSNVGGASYLYRLVVEPSGEPPRPTVLEETLHSEGKPLFEFRRGTVHLYNGGSPQPVTFGFEPGRSALGTISPPECRRFLEWISGLYCFRLNPFAMQLRADADNMAPNVDLSNFAAWYRHLALAHPQENAAFLESLRESLDHFRFLGLEPVGANARLLQAHFDRKGQPVRFFFNELSDGQRCLICLYAILHFVLARERTVILDEPENFIALRELQPWLMSVADVVDSGHGQILLISHHPEMLNQWAPDCGVQFLREDGGPVRIEEFRGDSRGTLSPAELVARGWERE